MGASGSNLLYSRFPERKLKGDRTKQLQEAAKKLEEEHRNVSAEETPQATEARIFYAKMKEFKARRKEEQKQEEKEEEEEQNEQKAQDNRIADATDSETPTAPPDTTLHPGTLEALKQNLSLREENLNYKKWQDDKSNQPRPDPALMKKLADNVNNTPNAVTRMLEHDGFQAFNGGYSMKMIRDIGFALGFTILYAFSLAFMGMSSKKTLPLPKSKINPSSGSSSTSSSATSTSTSSSAPLPKSKIDPSLGSSSTSSSTTSSISPPVVPEIDLSSIVLLTLWHFLTLNYHPDNTIAGSFLRSTTSGGFKEGCIQVLERTIRCLIEVGVLTAYPVVGVVECIITLMHSRSGGGWATSEEKANERNQIYIPEKEKKIMKSTDKNVRIAIDRLILISKAKALVLTLVPVFIFTEEEMFAWVFTRNVLLPARMLTVEPSLLSLIVPIPTVLIGSQAKAAHKRDYSGSKTMTLVGGSCHLWSMIPNCPYQAKKKDYKQYNKTMILGKYTQTSLFVIQ